MKAHIARNQNAGVPLALGWNLSAGDRGKLDGMAPAFGMKVLPVSPADAGKTVAQLLGEVETRSARTLVLEPGAYPSALVLANFKDKDVDTLLDLMKQAQVNIPLKAAGDIVIFGDRDHIGICSDRRNRQGIPFLIHHGNPIDEAVERNDMGKYVITGHFRWMG